MGVPPGPRTVVGVLTIGQLAAFAGVTVRAVQHYHQCGLLAEPRRDGSGYRRYDGQSVIDLLRIATLARAGVPLARVETLLAASPEGFAAAIGQLDIDLARQIARLQEDRHRITPLLAGERLLLPGAVVDYLDRLRAIGVSEITVVAERDGWILLQALAPDQVASSIVEKGTALDQPDFQHIYLAYDQAAAWDPADPRLVELADTMIAFAQQHQPDRGLRDAEPTAGYRIAETLLASLPNAHTPAWRRLDEICQSRLAAAGLHESP